MNSQEIKQFIEENTLNNDEYEINLMVESSNRINKEEIYFHEKEMYDLFDEELGFTVIDSHYKYHGCDHDLWEFTAIFQRTSDSKYFAGRWNDSYQLSYEESNYDEGITLFEVEAKIKEIIVYE